MVYTLVTNMGGMRDLREVECKACKKIGLTCYAQCRDPKCAVIHEIQVIE